MTILSEDVDSLRCQDLERHWHCHRIEHAVNARIEDKEIQATPSLPLYGPEDVLGWMLAEIESVVPQSDPAWRSNAQHYLHSVDLHAALILALSNGKTVGQSVRFSDQRMFSFYALSAGPALVPARQVLGALVCRKHVRGRS